MAVARQQAKWGGCASAIIFPPGLKQHDGTAIFGRGIDDLQARLCQLAANEMAAARLHRVAEFLGNLTGAWDADDQENRNRLATGLFGSVWL